jgi:hypothetical protein
MFVAAANPAKVTGGHIKSRPKAIGIYLVALIALSTCLQAITDYRIENEPGYREQVEAEQKQFEAERQQPKRVEAKQEEALLPEEQTFDDGIPVLALLNAECTRVPSPTGGLDDLVCSGNVKNIGSEEIKTASVAIGYYRDNGSPVTKDAVRIDTLPLAPGAVSAFDLNRYNADADVSATKWDIWFKTFFDDPIPMRDER